MATNIGFQIGSSIESMHLTDAKYIQGGYMVVDTMEELRALPIVRYYENGDVKKDGVIIVGSTVYVVAAKKTYRYAGIVDAEDTWEEVASGGNAKINEIGERLTLSDDGVIGVDISDGSYGQILVLSDIAPEISTVKQFNFNLELTSTERANKLTTLLGQETEKYLYYYITDEGLETEDTAYLVINNNNDVYTLYYKLIGGENTRLWASNEASWDTGKPNVIDFEQDNQTTSFSQEDLLYLVHNNILIMSLERHAVWGEKASSDVDARLTQEIERAKAAEANLQTKYELRSNKSENIDLTSNTAYTCTQNSLAALKISLPTTAQPGFISEVTFNGTTPGYAVSIIKNGHSLIYYGFGNRLTGLDYSSDRIIDLIFQYDGNNWFCFITEI